MSYKFLDHATDAIIEINAKNLKEAFSVTGDAVINLTLDQEKVNEQKHIEFSAEGKDLRYLLFNWIEEIIFVLITEGFAIKRLEFELESSNSFKKTGYKIKSTAFGEPLDFKKHNFKVEIKAPTFYDMEITQNEKNDKVYMRFLLDL